MRWLGAWTLAVLLAAGCTDRDGPPDEAGVQKPGDSGESERPGAAGPVGEGTEAEMDSEAAGAGPPEGYRERGEVLSETPATESPASPKPQQGGVEEGASQRAGFEEEQQQEQPAQQQEADPQLQEQQPGGR